VEAICISPAAAGPDRVWTAETCRARREAVEAAGLGAASMYWGVPLDVLIPDRRDQAIDRCIRQIAAAGAGGIPCLAYNLHVRTWRARTGKVPGRGGSTYSEWDLSKVTRQKGRRDIGPVDERQMWDRITYFLEKVVPAANAAKVRLACHPSDPPMPHNNPFKIAQVLDTVEGLKKFVSIADSPYHGLTFCQGSVWEMLPNGPDKQQRLLDAIRWFATRGKIHQVHFRNLRGGPKHFVETWQDDGDIDMPAAARAYRQYGYRGILIPDHVPGSDDPPERGFAWAYGYIKGVLQSVYDA